MSIFNPYVKVYARKDGSILIVPSDKNECFKPDKDMIEISGISSSLSVNFGADRYVTATITVRCNVE